MVLSGVLKTEMEETFRVIIPESERYGSTFVFRQGNPLLPDDLRTVAASAAAATVIVSDTSRLPCCTKYLKLLLKVVCLAGCTMFTCSCLAMHAHTLMVHLQGTRGS